MRNRLLITVALLALSVVASAQQGGGGGGGTGGGGTYTGTPPVVVTGTVISFSPTPALGTPSSITLTNGTGLPLSGLNTEAANTTVANVTSGTAVPTAAPIPSGLQNYVAGTGYNQATAHQIGVALVCAAASASTTTYTCTTSPAFTPTDGDIILFQADLANTGASTLAVNGQTGPPAITKQGGGTALIANDLLANQDTLMEFDGTNWQMQGQTGNASSAGSVTSITIAGTANQITATGTCTVTSTGTCTLSLPAATTLGVAGTSTGVIGLSGLTSGVATFTAPAVAGTSTNAVVSTNNISAPAFVSTVAIGTPPFTVTSTTNVPNLNASTLGGATFAAPGSIGGGTPGTATFTSVTANTTLTGKTSITAGVVGTTAGLLNLSGGTSGTATFTAPAVAGTTTNAVVSSNNISAPAFASTVAIGTAPFIVTSTTNVANLNASSLSGATFAAPGPIGSGTASTGAFTTLTATSTITGSGSGAGFFACTQGTTTTTGTTNITIQCPTAVTSYLETLPGTVAQGLAAGSVSGTTRTENFTGSSAYTPAVITIGSGASIGATSLCSTTNCPAGNYQVNVYVDITTACTTTGSYQVWLGYTDDAAAKTGSATTTSFPLTGNGVTPITSTVGASLALASTTNYATGSYFLHTTGAATSALGSINYGTTAGPCGSGGPMVGKMYLTVVPLS